jgi:hypothetical protein
MEHLVLVVELLRQTIYLLLVEALVRLLIELVTLKLELFSQPAVVVVQEVLYLQVIFLLLVELVGIL